MASTWSWFPQGNGKITHRRRQRYRQHPKNHGHDAHLQRRRCQRPPLRHLFHAQWHGRFPKEELDSNDACGNAAGGVDGIVQRGRAQLEDKTMYDAWAPALDALSKSLENGDDLACGHGGAVDAAEQGMKDTIPLQAKKGRASYLGERSIGHQDPGATSSYLMLNAF